MARKGGDNMTRKRRRREWKKEKQEQRKALKATAECICDSEKYGSHLVSCPAYDGKHPYTSSNTSYSSYGSYSYCKTLHWRTPVSLRDGLTVFASAWSDRPKYEDPFIKDNDDNLDYGFYLDDLWTGNRLTASPGVELPVTARKPAVIHFPCIDQRAPADVRSFATMIEWLLTKIKEGKNVDIGCIGGHGRTGLTLCSLLIMQGMDPWDALSKIRTEYCDEAVESLAQEDFLGHLWSLCNEGEVPRPNPVPLKAKVKTYGTPIKNEPATSTPIMRDCPACHKDVWYLNAHRDMCGGHPTTEELTEYINNNKSDTPTPKGLQKCIREGCSYSIYNQEMHDIAMHREFHYQNVASRAEEEVQEAKTEVRDPEDAEAYNEWLRLNTQHLKEQIESESGEWVEYDAWEASQQKLSDAFYAGDTETTDHVARMDEACPYGECDFPFECEPEAGECFRQIVRETDKREAYKGWAGDM